MASSPPIAAPVRSARRSPRWWRRFVVSSRRANFYVILEVIALVAVVGMVWSAWYTFTSAPPDGQLLPSRQVAVLLIGTLVPALERLFQASFLPKDIYLISRMPSDPQSADIVPIVLISLVLSFIATLYPSWRASRVKPAEALRYE